MEIVILRVNHYGGHGRFHVCHSRCIPSCSCLVAVMVTRELPSLARIFNSFGLGQDKNC